MPRYALTLPAPLHDEIALMAIEQQLSPREVYQRLLRFALLAYRAERITLHFADQEDWEGTLFSSEEDD